MQWHDLGMRGLLFAALVLGAVASNTWAGDLIIGARVVDESRAPIARAKVDVDGKTFELNEQGEFELSIDTADPVLVSVDADGYYGFVHTFHRADFANGSDRIADIELVARTPERRLLVFAGDAMLARRFFEPREGEPVLVRGDHVAVDGRQLLRTIKPYIELADYASVNLETQLSSSTLKDRLPKSVTFYSPTELASVLKWAGFDYVALGNNHTWDYQREGLLSTLAALDDVGLGYSGAGIDEPEARAPYITRLGDQTFGFLSYVGWPGTFTPTQAASGSKGGAALGGSRQFAEDIAAIPETISVLQYHSGLEYAEAPPMSERMRLRQAVDSGADIALGHHAHVVQGFEIHDGHLIAYSLGNFLFDQYHYTTQLGLLLFVWMDGDSLHRAEVVPMHINGYVPTPATGDFRYSVLHRLARLSKPLGTCLRANGAHAVIEHCNANNTPILSLGAVQPGNAPVHLNKLGLSPLTPAAFDVATHSYRLGTDILRRGDFEYSGLFGTHDRAWIRNDKVLVVDGESRALQVNVPRGENVRTGMKVFERIFSLSNPTTVRGRIQTDAPVTVRFLLQRRRIDDALNDALDAGPTTVVGGLRVAKSGWQDFSFDFDQPRITTRSVRLLIDIRDDSEIADGTTVLLDDLAWIKWRTPWLNANGTGSEFATHVQFRSKP